MQHYDIKTLRIMEADFCLHMYGIHRALWATEHLNTLNTFANTWHWCLRYVSIASYLWVLPVAKKASVVHVNLIL